MLYPILILTFSTIVLLSNILSAKIWQVPFTSFFVPIGLLFYPMTFLISDLVTEFFGKSMAKQMVILTLFMNLIALAMIQIALTLPGSLSGEMESAFQMVLGLSGLRIFSSLASYLISQIIDIQLYALIKSWTRERFLWLRNNLSCFASQAIDTLIIDIVYLWWGMHMPFDEVLPIMIFSFSYKAFFSVACTPLLYISVYLFKQFTSPFRPERATSALQAGSPSQ